MAIVIESRAQLEAVLAGGGVVHARWWVRCMVGPEWLGAGRRIELWLDDEPLDAGCAGHALLARALIARFALPEAHDDEVTSGSATIARRGDKLWIEYEWSRGVPYQDSAAADFDEGELLLPGG